jgi:REP-associated tyrosine transposase
VHIIFGTKSREQSIRDTFRERLHEYMAGIVRKEIGKSLKIGGTTDHAHALVELRTDVSVAEAVRKLKSPSLKWVHRTLPAAGKFAWQVGYAAFAVSRSNVATVFDYIANQQEHHRRMTFEEEFKAFLERHGVAYDPRHLW